MLHSYENLSDQVRAEAARLMQDLLYSGIDLYLQIKETHWTVRGRDFIALHRLFDEVADNVREISDDFAERIAQLGHKPNGTVQIVAANTSLPPYPDKVPSVDIHVEVVSQHLGAFISHGSNTVTKLDELEDVISSDLVVGSMRGLSKQLWMIASHLPT